MEPENIRLSPILNLPENLPVIIEAEPKVAIFGRNLITIDY
jgi:hypothetical protein